MPAPFYLLFDPWADLYGGSALISTSLAALHLAGMLVGGGFAIATDRATLRALRRPPDLRHHLDELESIHRPVLIGITLTFVTGLLMFAADLRALAASPVFWAKMVVLAGLLANGAWLRRSARTLRRGASLAAIRGRLAGSARASAALWLSALILGSILQVI
jgi:hypothetical protein